MADGKALGKSSIGVDEARKLINAGMSLVGIEEVGLADALGRISASSANALLSSPPFDVSSMDGYAVRAADVSAAGTTLPLRGSSRAGVSEIPQLAAGSCMRIFTGAPVPTGADAIIIQENAESQGDAVRFTVAAVEGEYVRRLGLNFKSGQEILGVGRTISARNIGLLAAAGHTTIAVRKRPRIAVLSTGDELAGDPTAISQGRILDANRPGLTASIKALGGIPVDLGIAGDTDDAIISAVRELDADLLIVTGGASVGDHDRVRPALQSLGFTFDFYKVMMRPGKPLMFGELKGIPVLGMPGNPVSALLCSLLFVKPAIEVMTGRAGEGPIYDDARLAAPIARTGQREDYLRAIYTVDDSGLSVEVFDQQDSSMTALLAQSNCLVVRPVGAPAAAAGEMVKLIRFDTMANF
ncbi:gephyrin-like molybdotransferase Glp [Mesorhizobium sp.]|uniref:molybdopterin molybdotransferase MoeA n=1 Tax=Mesorhizobium sp. TaxID=1871066 RepID=UPI0025D4E198|nr:gephyrin-like molybdotransferase Glp [Mesorhizobium sp.]